MMRSGRIRRQFLTRSRMVISPSPSRLGGRVSRRTTCGCCSCSSAESSQVMTRSSFSMKAVRQLSSVVLPEPVPPEISTLARTRPRMRSTSAPSGEIELYLTSCREGQLVLLELTDGERGAIDGERRGDHVDARAIRKARVADRRAFIDAAADLAHDALADVHQVAVVAEAYVGQLHLAADFDVALLAAVHHDVGDVVAGQQRLERTISKNVVTDVLEQIFLLGDRHDDRLERDDLGDDVANFLARRFLVHRGQLA